MILCSQIKRSVILFGLESEIGEYVCNICFPLELSVENCHAYSTIYSNFVYLTLGYQNPYGYNLITCPPQRIVLPTAELFLM